MPWLYSPPLTLARTLALNLTLALTLSLTLTLTLTLSQAVEEALTVEPPSASTGPLRHRTQA